jgi:SAM-dependent methyltransferase
MPADVLSAWVEALIARHTSTLERSEFLKAVRALSARYVERRSELARRSPADSQGKRAAFSAFFAPLHLITTREIVRALRPPPDTGARIVDLGCGTGAASAGWALAGDRPPAIIGVDRQPWALDEAAWNWRMLGLVGRTRRADAVRTVEVLARHRVDAGMSLVAAWSVNELDAHARAAMLRSLLTLADRGCRVLVIEPLARTAVPWWNEWTRAWRMRGGQDAEWKLEASLPTALAVLSDEAGFRRETLGARTLWVKGA